MVGGCGRGALGRALGLGGLLGLLGERVAAQGEAEARRGASASMLRRLRRASRMEAAAPLVVPVPIVFIVFMVLMVRILSTLYIVAVPRPNAGRAALVP